MLVKRKSHVDKLLKDELCLQKVQKEELNAPEEEVIAAETDENRLLMPQRKEKERKGKERKEEKRKAKKITLKI